MVRFIYYLKRANTTPKSHLIRDSVIEHCSINKIGEAQVKI